MIRYDMPLWRPPSEGSSVIIQITLGCSYNSCSFCSMYTSKHFHTRSLEDVYHDIDTISSEQPEAEQIFLADGDAMVLTTDQLHKILDYLHARLPRITRISSYATADNLNRKSVEELSTLRTRELSLLYLGIESGHADILKRVTKGASPDGITRAIRKASAAGLSVSCMVILGLGGREYSERHVIATAELLNRAPPTYLSTLQLDLNRAETPRFLPIWGKQGTKFQPLNDDECLSEMAQLIMILKPMKPIIFRSNHASNALPLKGVLPRDKEQLLTAISLARTSGYGVRPLHIRSY